MDYKIKGQFTEVEFDRRDFDETEVYNWLVEHFGPTHDFSEIPVSPSKWAWGSRFGAIRTIYFENQDDAMAFKLRWC